MAQRISVNLVFDIQYFSIVQVSLGVLVEQTANVDTPQEAQESAAGLAFLERFAPGAGIQRKELPGLIAV